MAAKPNYIRPLDIKNGHIDMNHGAGGRASKQLVDEIFAAAFDNPYLRRGDDAAVLPPPLLLGEGGRLVMATDAHVVSPLFFPGGDIGSLAVHGTINDLAMLGAQPLYLSASFILEEGFALRDLQKIVTSMARAAREAEVCIVTGDTKVVERNKGDGVYISTTGVGVVAGHVDISGSNAKVGDKVLISGKIADHGMAILCLREALEFEAPIYSDSAPLHSMVESLLAALPTGAVHVLRDPTRGGVATTLNEIAGQSQVGVELIEAAIPLNKTTEAACELLGLDPLYIANEGKLLAIVDAAHADAALHNLQQHPLGKDAAIIGTISADPSHFVRMLTPLGGWRVVDWLSGEPLPRIC